MHTLYKMQSCGDRDVIGRMYSRTSYSRCDSDLVGLTRAPGLSRSFSNKRYFRKRNGSFTQVILRFLFFLLPLLDVVSAAQLRQWARGGEAGRLERAVLAGQGHRLLAEAEALPIASHLPNLVAKCDALHAAVEKGSLLELQELLEPEYNKRKYVMCCDSAGVGLLHKAIFYDFMDIAAWLVDKYPQLVHLRDSEGRTPLHYSVVCRDEAAAAALLEAAGAARGARDAEGHTPAFYRGPARSRLALPTTGTDMAPDVRNTGLNIKRHNIRIWCHDCDMARLQRVVWEGHGTKLLSEVSNQPAVKRFLEAVPYIMNTIKDMHSCVIENDLEGLMKHAGHPVPPLILSSRDKNNMTVMHKAAGLGHGGILGYIADRYPEGINDVDNEGRTPLHYAAAVKDDQHIYNTLVSLGADESTVDNKNRTPGYYVNRPQEIDKNLFKVLPDAPRTPSSAYPPNWDWQILDTEAVVELNKKPNKKKNLKASNENISSKNMSNSISEKSNSRHKGMKASSTHEYIKGLPDLNGTKSKHTKKITNKDSEDVQDTNEEDNHDEKVDEPNTQDDTESNEIENKETEAHKSEHEEDVNNDEHEISGTKIEDKENVEPHDENDEEQEQEEVDKETEEKLGDEDEHHDSEKKEDVNIEPNEEENEDAPETHDSDNAEEEKVIDKEENKIVHEENTKESHVKHESNLDETSHKIHDTTEDNKSSPTKGNNEDDDDVQTQDDSHSEYSDIHLRSTAEAADRRSAKRGNENDDGRNTQDSLIEGIISGDAEQDTQDASIIRDENVEEDILIIDSQIDPEVTELINTSNMEMLAALVLNGEGARLVGRRSGNSELQAFLDNVPTYMQKINKVHLAARDGNIRDLQAALDRRKFAIARDPISPNGATPLHIATVFGKTNIMKYLGGRFPETLSAVDFEGRTALHYAAVIPDNGHYYNMLQQLGANSKDLDDNGRSAEEYLRNPNLLPFSQLISDYGISEEVAQEMLADKVPDDSVSSRRDLDTPEALETLERCYRLLVSAKTTRTSLSASSNRSTPPLVLGRFLKRPIFESIKSRVTKFDHNLFDIIWPAVKKLPENRNIIQTVEEDFPGGVTAPDYCVYKVFHEFLTPLIKDLHNINIHSELPLHPASDFQNKMNLKSDEPLVELNIDPNYDFVLSGTIECSRNIDGFELPLNLKIGQLEEIERIITTLIMQDAFANTISEDPEATKQQGGNYYTLNEVMEKPSEICATLASAGLLIALCDKDEIDDCNRLHGSHWPYGRGVFVSDDKSLAIWINVHDHLRVLVSSPTEAPGELGLPFGKLTRAMTYLHERLDFVWDEKLGHVSSRPTFLGAGLRLSFIINFPGLSKDSDNMKHLCDMRGLQYRETLNADVARVSNYQCLSVTETNCFNDFLTAASNLIHLEKDLSMQNSAHIATMLTNIFKRKRSSLVDLDDGPNKINK